MNVVSPALADRLAAAYVLGTLTGGARRRFEALLPAHPMLADAVAAWEARLQPLALRTPAVDPSPATWQRIEQRLFGAPPAHAATPRGWLRAWQAIAGVAVVAAVVLAALPHRPPPAGAPTIVVLDAPRGAGAMLVGLGADHGAASVRPLRTVSLAPDRSLELWAIPRTGAPRPLGLVAADRPTVLPPGTVPADAKGLAVSQEPLGGSPTGAPTGPIVFSGDL